VLVLFLDAYSVQHGTCQSVHARPEVVNAYALLHALHAPIAIVGARLIRLAVDICTMPESI
jgi:hypothetical protein